MRWLVAHASLFTFHVFILLISKAVCQSLNAIATPPSTQPKPTLSKPNSQLTPADVTEPQYGTVPFLA